MIAWRLSFVLALHLVPHGRALAQEAPGVLHAGGSSFMWARHATRSSSSLYAVSDLGRVSVVAAMVQNLRTGYREVLGGVLSTLSYDRQAITVALAYADASDASYLQAYLLPDFRAGVFSLTAAVEWYVPLNWAGTRQLYVNPVMVLARVRPWLAFGGSYALGMAAGALAKHRAGPAVELRMAPGAITLELLRGVERSRNEVRIAFRAGY